MIKLNFISRISVDKNFFIDLVYLIYQLKTKHDIKSSLYFIGAVESEPVYQTVRRLVQITGLDDQISFSKKSIRYDEMTDEVKKGFFINYCVGDFLGYSSIECLKYKLKTIFYNIDPAYSGVMNNESYACYCPDMNSLVDLIRKIHLDEMVMSDDLLKENQVLLGNFILQKKEEDFLVSVLTGNPLASEQEKFRKA